MWRRLAFCLVLALAAIAFAVSWEANGQSTDRLKYDFSDRKPIARPPEVHGWVLVRVCSITGRLDHRYTEYAYIKPGFIVAIGNPPTSPDPCVAIHGSNGKRLFVEGTLEGTARLIMEEADW